MSDYLEIQNQIKELSKQAKAVRRKEVQAVISDIKQKIKQYDITPAELGLGESEAVVAPRRKPARKTTVAKDKKIGSVVKYRNEKGETWSGAARGRKPRWVVEILAAGGDIEKYRV